MPMMPCGVAHAVACALCDTQTAPLPGDWEAVWSDRSTPLAVSGWHSPSRFLTAQLPLEEVVRIECRRGHKSQYDHHHIIRDGRHCAAPRQLQQHAGKHATVSRGSAYVGDLSIHRTEGVESAASVMASIGGAGGAGAGSAATADDRAVKLDDAVVSSMRVGAVFRAPGEKQLLSLAMHPTALVAAVSTAGDSIRVYDLDKRKCVHARMAATGLLTAAVICVPTHRCVVSRRVCTTTSGSRRSSTFRSVGRPCCSSHTTPAACCTRPQSPSSRAASNTTRCTITSSSACLKDIPTRALRCINA